MHLFYLIREVPIQILDFDLVWVDWVLAHGKPKDGKLTHGFQFQVTYFIPPQVNWRQTNFKSVVDEF